LIKQPICIGDIVKKINRKQYQNLKQFRNDFGLLCNNCRQFNEDGSVLFKDANNIEVGHTCPYKPCLGFFRLCELTLSQATVVRRLREETEEHPELQDWDDQTSSMADGTSTRPISSVGTPLANN
ncbi:hypothetical protein LTR28_002884, partial [Elasticomyces elasticus]